MRDNQISSKDAKRNVILDSATELLAIRPTSTMQEIADYAKIGIATLHRYFESRDKMMLELSLRAISLVEDAMKGLNINQEEAEKSLLEFMEVLIPLGNKIYFLGREIGLCGNEELVIAERRMQEPIINAIKTWQQRGKLRSDVTAEWIIHVMYTLLFATWQSVHEGLVARKSASNLMVNTLLFGFVQR